MAETIFFDVLTVLVFGLPGFFFLWFYEFQARNAFLYVMYSIFWGTILMLIFYYTLPIKGISPFIRNPYVGSVLVSVLASFLGWVAKKIEPRLRSWWILSKHI